MKNKVRYVHVLLLLVFELQCFWTITRICSHRASAPTSALAAAATDVDAEADTQCVHTHTLRFAGYFLCCILTIIVYIFCFTIHNPCKK